MHQTFATLAIVCPLVFLAGFVDAIAGGGGLISLPAYLFAGLPPHSAIATNKLSSAFGTSFSVFRYFKSGYIHLKSAVISAATALIGSFAGAKLALALDEKYLRYILIILLPLIGLFILTRKGFGEKDATFKISNTRMIVLSAVSGLGIGAYDGFFGPGTGTFLILVYTGAIGFSLIKASGNAKIVNLASNVAALVAFIASGDIIFQVGLPAAIFNIIGNLLGSGLAIKKGSKAIKPVFAGVLVLLFGKILYDLIIM